MLGARAQPKHDKGRTMIWGGGGGDVLSEAFLLLPHLPPPPLPLALETQVWFIIIIIIIIIIIRSDLQTPHYTVSPQSLRDV